MMNIEKFCEKYNFGKVINITKISGGLMHKMFKVETDKGVYCVKILNPEVMSRKEAYGNFVVSESVSNLAKKNGIPVSSALDIDGNYLTKLDNMYFMVFDYIEGKILTDDEITIEHCRKIGNVLAHIHSLDYKEIGLEPNIVEYKRLYDWEGYINNPNFNKMPYKNIFLKNYKKYNSMLKRANERFNATNKNQTICHSDMDPKNVMWNNDNPIILLKDNIINYSFNKSRFVVELKDVKLANKDAIQKIGAQGIVEIDNQLKIILGANAKQIKKYISELDE